MIEGKLTRRDFLALSAGAGGTLAALLAVGFKFGWSKFLGSEATASGAENNTPKIELDEATLVLLQEINSYRDNLGLSELNANQILARSANSEWKKQPEPYTIALPSGEISYGQESARLATILFGRVYPRLVRRIGNLQDDPGARAFNSVDRIFVLPKGFDEPLANFLDLFLHEVGGHASDPELTTGIYPPEIIFKLFKARYQALSEAFNVPGQFFNHPNDLMYPQMKKTLGTSVALAIRSGDLSSVLQSGQEEALETLDNIAKRKGQSADSLKFNKRVVFEIGSSIAAKVLNRKIVLWENARADWQNSFKKGLNEIWAEMVRLSINHDELLDSNSEAKIKITNAVVDALSIIQGKEVDIEAIRKRLRTPDSNIVGRNSQELQAKISKAKAAGPQVPSPEKISAPSRGEIAYGLYNITGILPEDMKISRQVRESLEKLGEMRVALKRVFPSLEETSRSNYDWNFDPEFLDVWEILDIQDALDTRVIRNWIFDCEAGVNIDLKLINAKIAVLNKYLPQLLPA